VINNELSRDEILNDLNLDPELKTVLYAPTWRGHQEMNLSSIPDMGLEICESIDENMNFIFKPHPIVKEHNEFPEIIEQIEMHAKNQQNFVYPDAFTDIIPLLYVSDLLITDFSTVAIEYLAFDRPMIFADHLGEVYNDHNLVEVWIREAGEIVRNPNEFKNAILRCLESPSEKSEIRRRYCDYFFYTLDGKASERAAKAIIELE
jgi:CDP-glycerol glycerophosphotransferase (TagB/SpsB family)